MIDRVFAKAGEPVTTPEGKVICFVKNDLRGDATASANDFHQFADGEKPWKSGDRVDTRCTRFRPTDVDGVPGVLQICINGEWRP